MKLAVAWVGKTKQAATKAGTEEYLGRLRGFARFATVAGEELAGKAPEQALLRRARGARLWLLDPAGRVFTSPEFARFLEREAAAYPQQELLFAVGGADGFGPEVAAAAAGRLSLSPLTLSHELARLVLLEQVYRALAILTHHPYPH
ncbi:MAG TPA: 23S rRNA (pseudouridine(1915)-N(3))-methyltransferase RlmH [Terriglobales bacterium]|nr:23S rRNA (pseudouridine(1915)-N(3))-methyltransferase RlmH [Terriglobales bacterium]